MNPDWNDIFEIAFCIALGVPTFYVVFSGFLQLCYMGVR